MDPESIIRKEIPDIAHIISDECWLEGERRGCAVRKDDAFIRERVADIILNGAGARIRRKHDGSDSAP